MTDREDNQDDGKTKVCSKCAQPKSFDDYNADSRRADGKRASCKACDAEVKKQIRNANLATYRARNKANNKKFRDKKREGFTDGNAA